MQLRKHLLSVINSVISGQILHACWRHPPWQPAGGSMANLRCACSRAARTAGSTDTLLAATAA